MNYIEYGRKTKVLIVDDSLFVRKLMEKVIQSFSDMKVIASASNGFEALSILKITDIDLIFMDLIMPKLSGIETLKIISEETPTPTIILTALEENENKELFKKIKRLGALGIVKKPTGIDSLYLENLRKKIEEFFLGNKEQFDQIEKFKKSNDLNKKKNIFVKSNSLSSSPFKDINRINHFKDNIPHLNYKNSQSITNTDNQIEWQKSFSTNVNVRRKDIRNSFKLKMATIQKIPKTSYIPDSKENSRNKKIDSREINPKKDYLLIFGASAGGPSTLFNIFSRLPLMEDLFIVIVQHMPASFTFSFAERLNKISPYHIKEAEDNEIALTCNGYVAPGDFHLGIINKKNKVHFILKKLPKINFVRPSVDYFIRSAIPIFNNRIIGVILTGIGADGAREMYHLKQTGGITIAQDKQSAQVWGMPKKAIELDAINYIWNIDQIPQKIYDLYKNIRSCFN
ncbi:MAG: chemotaxis protein CheB [Promethearchaeota archaeon]